MRHRVDTACFLVFFSGRDAAFLNFCNMRCLCPHIIGGTGSDCFVFDVILHVILCSENEKSVHIAA